MCGIAGFSLSPKERINPKHLARALLVGIESRGRDAAGACWRDSSGLAWVQKDAVSAKKLALDIDEMGRTAIFHARWATLGDPKNPGNNHPIDVGGIIGVHNGVISNHRGVFETINAERLAQVDSEAIFQLIKSAPDWETHPKNLFILLEGSASIAWMKTTDEFDALHVARIKSSPLVIAQTFAGSFVFASTMKILEDACKTVKLPLKMKGVVPEGTYFRIKKGVIHDALTFEIAEDHWGSSWATTATKTPTKTRTGYDRKSRYEIKSRGTSSIHQKKRTVKK